MNYQSINPATGETIASYPAWDDSRLETTLAAVAAANKLWRETGLEARCDILRSVAMELQQNRDGLAEIITREMGKPIREARGEIEKCERLCGYYAEHGPAMLADEPVDTEAGSSYISYLPLGTILAIMPWNFPFWQVFRFAVPVLLAGNTAVLKHASSVPDCALAIEDILQRGGLPEAVFRALLIDNDQAARVVADERIQGISLTGSERAGSTVAANAGRHIKKSVLELGGSDAFIVLEDADIEEAAEIAVASRYVNSGQSCIAAKRFILVDAIANDFISAFRERAARLIQGDPMDERTDIGPLARSDLCDTLHEQVQASIKAGARPLLGCQPRPGNGFYYSISVLTDVTPAMPAGCQELFGPVAAMLRAEDAEDALRLANTSRYGLGSTICSRHTERARQLARQLETGTTFINSMVHSDPRLPFGGIKHSGYGRELALQGIREFCNIKTVYVA